MASILPAVTAISVTMVILTMPALLHAYSEPCSFNPLCTCNISQHVVSCIGIPFATIPRLSLDDVYQFSMLRAGVEVLKDYSFQGIRLSSLSMMENELSVIYPRAFYGSESTLTTIDLSFNKLHQLPDDALRKLQHLQWLNLESNDIDDLPRLTSKSSLKSLLLGDNLLSQITERSFNELQNLTSLNLAHNSILNIDDNAFPFSLQSLSLSFNLLRQVPTQALQHLRRLTSLQMGGNFFHELPNPLKLPVNHLENLDFSHNLLSNVSSSFMSNSKISITNLHLEFNRIRTLGQTAFQRLILERLSLANNRLTSISDGTFAGLQDTLKALDVSYNLLQIFPKAIKNLVVLKVLSLRGNFLEDMDISDLYNCRYNLEVLDLSGNKLNKIPRDGLRITHNISHLDLQDNAISEIKAQDFVIWGHSLTALNLANNKLLYISDEAFLETTKLRNLKISYNNYLSLNTDILKPIRSTLEILEIGSFNTPALKELQGFKNIRWLQMDHNNLKDISSSAFEGMPWLIHCDLEGNKLRSVPSQLFRSKVHTLLNNVVLANNHIEIISSNTFLGLPLIANIVLFGNKLKTLQTLSFRDMKLLNTIILARNQIQTIEIGAFTNLRILTNIFLQDNHMKEFSFDIFDNVGNIENPVSLDISNNYIMKLKPISIYKLDRPYIKLRSLDLRNNRISSIEKGFLKPVSETLRILNLSSNRISSINSSIFAEVPYLQVIYANNNSILNLLGGVFQYSSMLQIINLSHNKLTFIANDTFSNLSSLRILDLSFNGLEIIPKDVFVGCKLERLNFSKNNIIHPPLHSLVHVQSTLRYLDLSRNKIRFISSSALSNLYNLLNLNLSSNNLTNLGENIFIKLLDLLHLDLSHNTLLNLDDEPLKPLVSLQTLLLRNVSLYDVPSLPLPSLRTLDLSYNLLYNISDQFFVHLKDLRRLDLSHNHLKKVPQDVWPTITKLTNLDISYNPIQVLNMSSFQQLEKLRELDLRGLDLKYLDFRILHNLKFLNTFKINTYVNLQSFRLKKLLSESDYLQRVFIEIEETNLTHQLQWTFGSKLRELTITGRNLQYIIPDAFLGLQTHELTLRITGTSISRLPKGFLKHLANIWYLTLDLRGNLLTSMDEDVLRPTAKANSGLLTTRHILGGVLLENNPWVCDFSLVWLGKWIRRWMRETQKIQTLHSEGYLYFQNHARKTLCALPNKNITMAIVDLDTIFDSSMNDTTFFDHTANNETFLNYTTSEECSGSTSFQIHIWMACAALLVAFLKLKFVIYEI